MNLAYKYCSQHGIDILESLELKITPPNQFNDPFEFTPSIITSNPVRKAKEVLKGKEYIGTIHQKLLASGRFYGGFRQFKRYVKHHREEMAQDMSRYFATAAAEVQKEILDNVSKVYGVLCLEKNCDSILMWGHYCDKHRGLVIGFDSSSEVFQGKKGRGLRPVVYVKERVLFDATWDQRDPKVMAFEEQMVYSKNSDWSYEEELRQFLQLVPLKRKPLNDETRGYFMPIPSAALVSVTLGARCSAELEKKFYQH
jgi:hypothetical protein